jgi:hypothetical protein
LIIFSCPFLSITVMLVTVLLANACMPGFVASLSNSKADPSLEAPNFTLIFPSESLKRKTVSPLGSTDSSARLCPALSTSSIDLARMMHWLDYHFVLFALPG